MKKFYNLGARSETHLTLCILMDFPIYINTIRMRLSIIYIKSGVQTQKTSYGGHSNFFDSIH